jgi:hypothetical protein
LYIVIAIGYLRDTIINATGLSNNNSCASLFANPDFFQPGFKLKGDQYVQFIWCGVGIKLGKQFHIAATQQRCATLLHF